MIFCVEDDSSVRELIIYTLRSSGFEAEGFSDGEELFAALAEAGDGTNMPELIMLDVMLPGNDGMAILKKLRSTPGTAEIPIIMESAKDTEFDKVVGLDLGADDYLAKPFGMMEMIARIKAVLRRSATPNKDIINNGKLSINLKSHKVTVDGRPITLTLKEFEILLLFMQNPEIVFSRENLLSSIWGMNFVGESRTVDVHIGTLRTKLGECAALIETVRGVGYRMSKK